MSILITGASGLLGAHLMARLAPTHDVIGTDRHPWWGDLPVKLVTGDLTERGFIADVVAETAPDLIIHCAGMVSVDGCEENPGLAHAYNTEVTRELARAAPAPCLFVYVTTDGIFKGDTPFAAESQLPCPRTVYGRSKLHGEWEVEQATDNHLIVRTNFYGWSSGRKRTSAEWLYHALEAKETITLFDDFFFTPIYVVDLVERLKLLLEGRHRGIFHLCGAERVSKYQFGMLVADLAKLSTENVLRASMDKASMTARRPKDMSLSSERFRRATGVSVPACASGLLRFLADRERPLSARFETSRAPAPDGTTGAVRRLA